MALIVTLSPEFTVYDLIRELDRACTLAASYLGLTLTVGVGAPCGKLSGMARSAAEAKRRWNTARWSDAGRSSTSEI